MDATILLSAVLRFGSAGNPKSFCSLVEVPNQARTFSAFEESRDYISPLTYLGSPHDRAYNVLEIWALSQILRPSPTVRRDLAFQVPDRRQLWTDSEIDSLSSKLGIFLNGFQRNRPPICAADRTWQ